MEELLQTVLLQFPVACLVLIVVWKAFGELKKYQDKSEASLERMWQDNTESQKAWREHSDRREDILNQTLQDVIRRPS